MDMKAHAELEPTLPLLFCQQVEVVIAHPSLLPRKTVYYDLRAKPVWLSG